MKSLINMNVEFKNACYYATGNEIISFLEKTSGKDLPIKGREDYTPTSVVINWIKSLGIDPIYKQHSTFSCGVDCCGYGDTVSISEETMLQVVAAL